MKIYTYLAKLVACIFIVPFIISSRASGQALELVKDINTTRTAIPILSTLMW